LKRVVLPLWGSPTMPTSFIGESVALGSSSAIPRSR
jgi:hypothetical protein